MRRDGHNPRPRSRLFALDRRTPFSQAVARGRVSGSGMQSGNNRRACYRGFMGLVGVAIDALMPFTFMSPEEWHDQHIPPDEREPAVRGSHQKIVSVIESLSQSLLKASSLRGLRYTDLTRLLHRT